MDKGSSAVIKCPSNNFLFDKIINAKTDNCRKIIEMRFLNIADKILCSTNRRISKFTVEN